MADFAVQAQRLEMREAAAKRELGRIAATKRRSPQEKAEIDDKAAEAKALLDRLEGARRPEPRAPSRCSRRRRRAAPPPRPSTPVAGLRLGRAAAAVRYALAQVGDSYVYGAAGPSAFDCSGLTMMAWAQAGVGLPHSSSAQMGSGTPGLAVPAAARRPGLLLQPGQPRRASTSATGRSSTPPTRAPASRSPGVLACRTPVPSDLADPLLRPAVPAPGRPASCTLGAGPRTSLVVRPGARWPGRGPWRPWSAVPSGRPATTGAPGPPPVDPGDGAARACCWTAAPGAGVRHAAPTWSRWPRRATRAGARAGRRCAPTSRRLGLADLRRCATSTSSAGRRRRRRRGARRPGLGRGRRARLAPRRASTAAPARMRGADDLRLRTGRSRLRHRPHATAGARLRCGCWSGSPSSVAALARSSSPTTRAAGSRALRRAGRPGRRPTSQGAAALARAAGRRGAGAARPLAARARARRPAPTARSPR